MVNHMLSLFGSLLRKPFSIDAPTCIPSLVTTTITAAERQRRVHFQEEAQSQSFTFPHNAEGEEDEGDSDDDDEGEIPTNNAVSRPEVIRETSSKKSKKRSKIGPKREGEVSGSESETEVKRDKKKRKT